MNFGQPKTSILIIDSDEKNLHDLRTALDSPDYNLVSAASVSEAIGHLLKHKPAVILMDLQVPGINGFENAYARETPIIFITDHEHRLPHRDYAHGPIDYICKPYDARALRSKVAAFVDLRRKTMRLIESERERRIMELELKSLRREQAEQGRYVSLIEGIDHGILWTADAETMSTTFVSPSAERILRHPMEHWHRQAGFLLAHTHTDDAPLLRGALSGLRTGRNGTDLEHRFLMTDGSVVWLHTILRATPKSDVPGMQIRGLSIDITRVKQAEEALRRSHRRSSILAEASLLVSESLDPKAILSRLGTLAVPSLADLYIVHLADDDGALKVQAATSATVHIADLPRIGSFDVMITKHITDAHARLYRNIRQECPSLAALGMNSAVTVPLAARGRALGILTLASSRIAAPYEEGDLALIEDLARRAATALENANLYQQAQAALRARDEFLSASSPQHMRGATPNPRFH